ncbi:nucleolar pre-ribosomal-associated protein 1 isoform X2 [Anabrus simplex]|uniref:nucleolar pre-ribosomal-associated protein 1 isoform X2 n=1 Tax=Anabrus simplex TaxID=316456 RepID=UPI0035A3B04D
MGVKRKRDIEEKEDEDEVNTSLEKKKEFPVANFCKNLRGDNCFRVLKEFVQHSKLSESDEKDVVVQLLDAGGGANDVVHVLTTGKVTLPSQHAVVFQALSVIIMRTLTAVPDKQLETEQACHQLLSLQLHTIHSMLSEKATVRHKKIVLRLLTAMVSLSVSLAREILSHVTFNPAVVEALTRHSKPSDKLSVRTCFIHFLLALLVEGNTATIRPLLDKKGLLASIVPGLKQDNADLVVLVLTTLRTKLVENSNITKTSKLHLFNTQVIHSLLDLYEWKGSAMWTPKAKRRRVETSTLHDEVDSDDRLMVAEAVHELLLKLCSSHKCGLAFHDKSLGTSGARHNQLVFTVLQHIEQPWEKKLTGELMVQTLRACPDLVRSMLTSWESFLEPRASRSWLQAVNLLKEVLMSLDPEEYLKPNVDGLLLSQLLSAVQVLTVPAGVLSAVGVHGLQHHFASVRHEVVCMLVTMLDQLYKVVTALESWNLLSRTDIIKFKQGINSYLTKHLPSGDVVYAAWQKELLPPGEGTESVDSLPLVPNSIRQNALLDLLLLYHKCCPNMVNHLDFKDMWSRIQIEKEGRWDQEEDIEANIQLKVLQLLLGTDITSLSPNKDHFGKVLLQLLTLSRHCSPSVSKIASQTLLDLLHGTGLFDGSGDELNVWLHCYMAVPQLSCNDIASFFTHVVTHTAQNLSHYNDLISQVKEEDTNEDSSYSQRNRIEDVFTDLMEDDLKESELVDSSVFAELSPLLACALEMSDADPTESVIHFLSCVVVHLLHSQTVPAHVIRLACRWAHLPASVSKYLESWNPSNVPVPLKKPFGASSLESRLSRALLQSENSPTEWPQEDPVHDLLLFRLALFHVLQLASRGQLSEVTCNTSKVVFQQLFDIIQEADPKIEPDSLSVKCLKSALSHPVILQFFSPLYRKKHVEEKLVTELVMELLNMASSTLKKHKDVSNLFIPFRRKLLSSIARITRHPEKAIRGSELILSTARLLQLRTNDITIILGHLAELPSGSLFSAEKGLSTWGLLLINLLRKTEEPIAASTVTALVDCIVELNGADSELANSLNQYLTRFPHSMAHISPDGDTCKQICKKVLKKYVKYDRCDPLVLTLMETVFKCGQTDGIELVYLDQLAKCLEAGEDPSEVCQHLINCVDSSYAWLQVRHSETWSTLPAHMLRLGMAKGGRPILLTTLSKVIGKMLGDNDRNVSKEMNFIFEMVLSHSEFLDVMLGPDSDRKRGMVELMLALAKNNPAVLRTKHVPIILGAYGATLSITDQILLQLLHLCESSGAGSLHQYRPYLWGEAAVSHYSIRSTAALALWRVPKANQVLELLDPSIVNNTICFFPAARKLQKLENMFPDRRDVYDPAFILPLFSHLLAPESVVYTHKVNHCGALALTICALASNCPDLRAAGGHVLARYHDQLEAGRSGKEERLLLQFISAIRSGVSQLMEEEDGADASDSVVPQLPSIAATFLARASLIMSQPLHSLYLPLHDFILAKPALDLRTVPELLPLLRNDHVDFRLYRIWILKVIRDGFHNKQDVEVSFRHALFKLIMDLYSSVLVDSDTKVLILQVLERALSLPSASSQLVLNHGLLPWLHHCISNLVSPVSVQLISAVINILSLIQKSSATAHNHLVISLLLLLLPLIPSSLSEVDLCCYFKCILATQSFSSLKSYHLEALVALGKTVIGVAEDCEYLLRFGCKYTVTNRREEDSATGVLRKVVMAALNNK